MMLIQFQLSNFPAFLFFSLGFFFFTLSSQLEIALAFGISFSALVFLPQKVIGFLLTG
jgi:hypothetical protein